MRSSLRTSLVLVILLSFSAITRAQTLAGVEQGIKPYGSYEGGSIDSISMVNGSITLNIPLLSYPQRGSKLHAGFRLVYANPWLQPWAAYCDPYTHHCGITGYNLAYDLDPSNCGYNNLNGQTCGTAMGVGADFGYGLNVVLLPGCCPQGVQYYKITDSDNAVHVMGYVGAGQYRSVDATGYLLSAASSSPDGNATLWDRQGNKYFFSTWALTKIEDPNGNQVTMNTNSQGAMTDTLGRVFPAETSTTDLSNCPASATTASLWTPPGPSGGTSQFKTCWATINISFNAGGTNPTSTAATNMVGLVLPNLTAWTFAYDNFGELTTITLPTGGTISYTWTSISGYCVAPQYVDPSSGANTGLWPYRRAVTSRTVNANDGTGPHTWNYVGNGGNGGQAIATDPLGNDTVHTETSLGGCSIYETELDRYSGSHTSGTLVQKTTTSYSYGSGGGAQYGFGNVEINVVPNAITTTDVLSGKVSQVTKTFDTGVPDGNSSAGGNILYGALLSENHYDWGNGSPGNLLRQTNTQYMALTGPNSSYYLGDNLLSLPYTVQVQNGAGAQASLLQYNYDEYSLVSSGVTTQRDTSPPNAPYRGNQTSVHRWLNSSTTATTNCNISVSNGYLVSYAVYNDTGTVDHSVDSCGSGASDTNHTSSYAYSLTYAGAYPTAITNPLGQTAATAYDFNTGRLTSATDPNQQTTNYTYDNMWRIVSASYPDGGSSTITHQESSFPFSATLTKALNSSQNYAETNIFDGFGRVAHHQITSDPQGTVYADTAYDADGRVATVSNPYRSTGDSTYGTASTTYDALNRPTSVTRPDNSIVHTAYCGPTTLVTDEANHWRRSTTDALGRLIEVDEPNSVTATVNSNGCPGTNEPIWVTTYGYDALDGLTGVVQGGSRNRSFLFDSVKHLTSSTNPEAGTVTYGYDANSNVVTKTDARSITVTHSYDPLNRITAITYSNSDPSLSYAYDQATCIGQSPCYNVGRRTTMSDAGGTENLSYDKMGREWGELRTTNGSAKTTTYTYDLAGDLTALTYPSGRTITYTYDSAGRPSDAIDAADGIDYVTGSCSNGASSPSTGACYAPQGAVAQIQNGANLISTYIYNDRLQPCWIYATTGTALSTNTLCTASATVGNIFDLKYSFNLGSGDNGNVMGITNNRDTTRSQSFAYDHVNRILSGQTSATTGPNCWGETYSYDQWANLLSIGAVSGYTGCTQENLSVSATLSNQITFVGASYDASGNMLADGANSYTYNAESEISTAAGVNYTYDADGNRVEKSNGKIYWYGAGTEILNESDLSGNFTNEYVFFAGKRVARWDLTSAYSALPGTGTATIGGSEQSIPGTSAAPGTGTVTISGTERSRSIFSKVCNCLVTTYDSGTVSIIVNGHADSATYGQNSASSSIASALVSAINVDSAAVVTASASGSTVTLTAKTTGPSTNYSLSASVTSQNGFSPPSFTATPSGSTLTGGANYSPTVYDSGSVWVTVNGFQAAANYGQGDTAASVASAIANVFNTTSSSPVTATVSGATLTLTARTAGSSTNFSLASGSSTSQGSFSSPSFTTSTSGPTLTGGRDAGSGNIYYYLEDLLGSSRTIVQAGQTSPCYDADFYPFGGERVVTSTCPQNYRFEGKERDSETGNDDFGARYYSNRFGRWLSADCSAVPEPVPYANLTNPQTLNLYAMVADDPESFADLDGHDIKYDTNLQNAQLVKDTVQAILADPNTSANLSGYVGKDNPDLTIQSGDLSKGDTVTKNPDGTVTTTTIQGETAPAIQTMTSTENGVKGPPETILTGATITIDNRTSKADIPGVMVHETVHAGEAKADPAKFSKDAAAEKSLPHDQRPQEQRANVAQKTYTNEIKKAVKQIEKDRKRENQ